VQVARPGIRVVVYDHSFEGNRAWFRFAFKWSDPQTGESRRHAGLSHRVRQVCRDMAFDAAARLDLDRCAARTLDQPTGDRISLPLLISASTSCVRAGAEVTNRTFALSANSCSCAAIRAYFYKIRSYPVSSASCHAGDARNACRSFRLTCQLSDQLQNYRCRSR
jgi:hypothetical protein